VPQIGLLTAKHRREFSDSRFSPDLREKGRAHRSTFGWGGGLRFKSILDHTSVFQFSVDSENRSKSARVRANFDRVGTWRAFFLARFAQIGQFLSRRDLPRSHCPPGERPSHVAATEQCVPDDGRSRRSPGPRRRTT